MPVAVSSSPRTILWEWIQAALLALNLGWTTLCLGGYRPETMIVTSVLTGALLVVHLAGRAMLAGAPRIQPASWWLLPFLVYAAGNVMAVSPVPWLGWLDWFGWAQMITVFWVVHNGVQGRRPRGLLLVSLFVLALVSVLLACYQRFLRPDWLMLGRVQDLQFAGRASGPFGIPNSLAAFFLLLLPTAGALAFRAGAGAAERVGWAWVAVVLAFGLVLTISRGAWLALALALTAWPLTWQRWRWRRRSVFAVATLVAVMGVGAILYSIAPKVHERIGRLVPDAGERTRPIMWRAAWQLFREHPFRGSGAGSYNVQSEKYRPERFHDELQWAHNDYLNTLSDYGAAGFILLFGAWGAVACSGRRDPRGGPAPSPPHPARSTWETRILEAGGNGHAFAAPGVRSALGIGLLAFALQLVVDFHLKIPALAMAFATVAALALGRPCRLRDDGAVLLSPWTHTTGAVAALGVVIGVAGFFLPLFRGEALRYRARQAIDQLALVEPSPIEYRLRLVQAHAFLTRAVELSPRNAQAWGDLAYGTALSARAETGRDVELGRQSEIAARRAIELAPACFEFWIRRAVARDMQGFWLEAGNDSAHALALAPNNAWAWYFHAEHLSRRPSERELAWAALAFCLRLDPWNPAGLALRQRLAIGRKAP